MEKHYRAAARSLIYPALLFLLSVIPAFTKAQHHAIQDILALLERGQFSSASHLLQINLQMDSTDTESRILLGSIMEHSGMRTEAIRLWQQGLQHSEKDYALLMSIGESYLREAEILIEEDNIPNTLLPLDRLADNPLSYLDSAIAAFQKAASYYPHEADPLQMLANACQLKGEHEQALEYARLLARIFPTEEKNHALMGLLLIQTGDYQAAEKAFEKSLELNPHYTTAQKGMAEVLLLTNRTEEAGEMIRRAAFHDFVPSFIGLPFSPENYDISNRLSVASATENEDALRDLLIPMLEDDSAESTRWIALMFWHQAVPSDLDEIAWEQFASRGVTAQRLIMEMARHTENQMLLGRLCKTMVQLRIPGTFEMLVNLLPKDKMTDSPLRIAYCLAALGDELAVPYLIRELQYDDTEEDDDYDFSKEGRIAARQRAVLALSYFNNSAAIKTLQKGLNNNDIKPYCAVALYRLTMEEHYLEPIRQMAYGSKKDVEIAHFLRFIGTHEAERIAKLIE